MWKIRLVLEGGLIHTTNDVRSSNPGWSDCQPSGIERMEMNFLGTDNGRPAKFRLIMAGMKEYNFFVEAIRSLDSNGKVTLKGLWFLGRLPNTNKVTGFVIKEKLLAVNTEYGKEYGGFATVGWKSGIIGGNIISGIERSF